MNMQMLKNTVKQILMYLWGKHVCMQSAKGVSDWKNTWKMEIFKSTIRYSVYKIACYQMTILIQSSYLTIKEYLSAEHFIAEERK